MAFIDFLKDVAAERCWLLELNALPLAVLAGSSSAFGEGAFSEFAFGEDVAGAAGGETTLYFSSHGFISQAADTPARTYYDAKLTEDVHIRRSIVGTRGDVGGLTHCFAEIALVNADGELDLLNRNFALTGRTARLLLGRMTEARSTFGLVFYGVVEKIDVSFGLVRITLSDGRARLGVPVNATTYAGAGTNEGGSDLKGKPKPVAYGSVLNVPAPLVDSATLVFQVHDGAISSAPAAYDRGVALALVGGAPGAGQYQVTAASGTIKLGGTPSGAVTVDVLGDSTGGYINKVGEIVNRILLSEVPLTAGEIDAASFTQLNADAPAEVGIWVGTEPATVEAVIERLLVGIGAFGGFSRTGTFTVGQISAATGASVMGFTEAEILDIERLPMPEGIEPIIWRALVAYQHNYLVQTDLASSVTAARRTFASQADRLAIDEDTGVLSRHKIAREYGPTENLYAQAADAQAETVRLRQLWGVEGRALFRITLPPPALELDLGQVIDLTHARFGLSAGVQARILGHEISGPRVTLTVLV